MYIPTKRISLDTLLLANDCISSQLNWVYKKDRKTTHVSYRYSIMIHSLLLKMKARQIHIMSQNNDRIVSDLLFYCHLGTCQNQLCATPLKKKRNKSLPCSVLSKLFNNGSRAISDALIYHLQGVPSIGTHFRFQFLTFLMVL